MPRELYLIDSNSYAYRAFYALGGLTTSKGEPIGAVYGFFNMLFKVLASKRPEYLALIFDHPSPTFRHKKFEEYKIHRKKMPDDLIEQFPLIKEIAGKMNLSVIDKSGFEADDILATLAERFKSKLPVFIITGDKDILQIVDSRVKVINPHKEELIFDEEKVKEKFGLSPKQIVDFLALSGDSSDNIPGVPGIGPKTALGLIKEFGSFQNIYQNLSRVKGEATRTLLKEHHRQALLSRELAHLDREVEIEVRLDDLRWGNFDKEKLKQAFKQLEFNRLIKRLEELPLS